MENWQKLNIRKALRFLRVLLSKPLCPGRPSGSAEGSSWLEVRARGPGGKKLPSHHLQDTVPGLVLALCIAYIVTFNPCSSSVRWALPSFIEKLRLSSLSKVMQQVRGRTEIPSWPAYKALHSLGLVLGI